MRISRQTVYHVLLALFSTLFSIMMSETILRYAILQPGFEARDHEFHGMISYHPVRNYTFTPNFKGKKRTERGDISIVINALGVRDNPVSNDRPVDSLALGDSFTAAAGVEVHEGWANQLEAMLPKSPNVLAAGVAGYSLLQIRQLAEEFIPMLQPKLVILGLFTSRYWRIKSPYIYYKGMSIQRDRIPYLNITEEGFSFSPYESKGLREVHWWCNQHFYIGAIILQKIHHHFIRKNVEKPNIETRLQILFAELKKIHDTTTFHQIPLVVFLINSQRTDGAFHPREQQYNDAVTLFSTPHAIHVFDPLPTLTSRSNGEPIFRMGSDFHWSPHAHNVAAEGLAAFVIKQGLWRTDGETAHQRSHRAR